MSDWDDGPGPFGDVTDSSAGREDDEFAWLDEDQPGCGQDRERFDVTNAAVAADALRERFGTGKLAGLYLRDGLLVHTPRTGEEGYVPPTEKEAAGGIDHGPAQVRPVSAAHVKALMDTVYEVGRNAEDKKTGKKRWVRALFPAGAASSAADAASLGMGCPNLRTLSGITHTPVLRADGSLLSEPGYDQATGMLYLPGGGLEMPPVPACPSEKDVAEALAFLVKPIEKFPFVSPYHAANYLGAMITPAVRLVLPPPYPMLAVTATNPGSGKTLLMRLLGIVHGIATRGEFPREREEMRKLIISTLLSTTAPVIGWDNVRGTIYSSELESTLTARTVGDRGLGTNLIMTADNDRLWVVTGNNLTIGGDLQRRVLPAALDPRCPDPYRRKFDLDPAAWMAANRGPYLAALLTVARAWVQAGMPWEADRSDDYARWYGSMRAMLGSAGLTWNGQAAVFGGADEEDSGQMPSQDDAEWGAFLAEVERVFGDSEFTARELVGVISSYDEGKISPHALPGDLADKWDRERNKDGAIGFTKSLGKWLGNRDGRYTPDGLAVRKAAQTGKHAVKFQVVRQDTTES